MNRLSLCINANERTSVRYKYNTNEKELQYQQIEPISIEKVEPINLDEEFSKIKEERKERIE